MHQEDDEELNDEEFAETVLVAAQNQGNLFHMTESDDISLALFHSEESLGGAHFEIIPTEEHVDDESIPSHLQFTIEQLEEFNIKDLVKKEDPEITQEDFRAGSN